MPKKTYRDVMSQIERLQREAEALRQREVAGVVARIKEAIAAYGLTADDLGLSVGKSAVRRTPKPMAASPVAATRRGGKRTKRTPKAGIKQVSRAPRRAAAKAPSKLPVKFRDNAGNTWTGRGSRPRWLAAHLDAGRKIEEFAVKA